jgi:putative endonuclease
MNGHMGPFVYMLRCRDGSYYIGSATGNDLTKRVQGHQSGLRNGYTSSRLSVELIWSEYFDRITDAIAVERKPKGWSRRKKEALLQDDWDRIKILAKRPGARS